MPRPARIDACRKVCPRQATRDCEVQNHRTLIAGIGRVYLTVGPTGLPFPVVPVVVKKNESRGTPVRIQSLNHLLQAS